MAAAGLFIATVIDHEQAFLVCRAIFCTFYIYFVSSHWAKVCIHIHSLIDTNYTSPHSHGYYMHATRISKNNSVHTLKSCPLKVVYFSLHSLQWFSFSVSSRTFLGCLQHAQLLDKLHLLEFSYISTRKHAQQRFLFIVVAFVVSSKLNIFRHSSASKRQRKRFMA